MKAIRSYFLGQTNHKPSRIKATDNDGNSVTLNYDHALNSMGNHEAAVKALLTKLGWAGEWYPGWTPGKGYVWVCPIKGNGVSISVSK